LWQKIDEASGKPVVWFLFIDRGGVYEGIAAATERRPEPLYLFALPGRP
jgi:hypothetical protein